MTQIQIAPKNDESMRLGKLEYNAMNNGLRRFIQKYVEFKIFKNMLKRNNIDLMNTTILDGGCGSGYSSKLLLEAFQPNKIIAFDYMPEQIELALRRNLGIHFFVGDLRSINQPENSLDACFIFGVIHHIPDWQNALREVFRVLRPNGVLLIEEPHYRFEFDELEQAMIYTGFSILEQKKWLFGYFRSYLVQK